MCSICENTLVNYPFKHDDKYCPLAAATYCSLCCKYGHSQIDCSNRPSIETITRKPLKEIQPKVFVRDKTNTFEMADHDRSMRAFLYSQGVSTAGKKEVLKAKIKETVKEYGYENTRFI